MTDTNSMGNKTNPDHQNEERFDLSGGSEHHPCVHLAALAPHSSHLQVSHLLHCCFWSTTFPISSSTILTVSDLILKTFTYSSLYSRDLSWFLAFTQFWIILVLFRRQDHSNQNAKSLQNHLLQLFWPICKTEDIYDGKNRFSWICPRNLRAWHTKDVKKRIFYGQADRGGGGSQPPRPWP